MLKLRFLDEINPRDLNIVGGKALQLARLKRGGLPVPPGFVIPADALFKVLRFNGLLTAFLKLDVETPQAELEAFQVQINSMEIPHLWKIAISRASSTLGPSVAVRSSALDEDSSWASHAGQYDSELAVARPRLVASIKACWASSINPRALSYRQRQRSMDTTSANHSMAVLIQAMLPAEISGALFTANPMTGSRAEMVIESVWGLGHGLVSGRITPHWHVLKRSRKRLFRTSLSVIEQDCPEITRQWVSTDGGIEEQPLPARHHNKSTLSTHQALMLGQHGLRAESLLGMPLDIEWALDANGEPALLQARPITGLNGHASPLGTCFTRRFFGERWPRPASPLGWSIVSPVLESFLSFPHTQNKHWGSYPLFKLHQGRPYVNIALFRELMFKLPGVSPPRFLLEIFPPEEARQWKMRLAGAPNPAVIWSLLSETLKHRRWRDFELNPISNPQRWDLFNDHLRQELSKLNVTPRSMNHALHLAQRHEELLRDYVGIHISSLFFANMFDQTLESALNIVAPERSQQLMRCLAVCPPGNKTLQTNEALHTLGKLASETDLSELEKGTQRFTNPAFERALQAFLQRYGHRSQNSWELFSPRWKSEPAGLGPLLRAQKASETDPKTIAYVQEQMFEEARSELRIRLGSEGLSVALGLLIQLNRRYLLLRENQRFAFDYLMFSLQHVWLWTGEAFTQEGWLDKPQQISLLSRDEVQSVISGNLPPETAKILVAQRAQEHKRFNMATVPAFLDVEPSTGTREEQRRLEGLGISPGRVTGRVRILHNIEQGTELQPGEILICTSLDPGWTPLLLTASAVVLELGGRLSHGAVIAREYGVPAVVNLEGITSQLRDGQKITVDGTRGLVWLLED